MVAFDVVAVHSGIDYEHLQPNEWEKNSIKIVTKCRKDPMDPKENAKNYLLTAELYSFSSMLLVF